jgi:rhamnosyltransferase
MSTLAASTPRSAPPRILVLLASFNGARWIEEQIDSVLAQRGVAVHLMVRDDVSSDGTWALLTELYGMDQRVTLTQAPRASGSAGANFRALYTAASLTGYDHVALADQDDVWLPNKLSRAVEVLTRDAAQGYSCAVEAFWANGRRRAITQSPRQRAADFLFEGAGQGCTFVLTAALFERVQIFCRAHRHAASALHYHDWLVYLLARTWRERWTFDLSPQLRYRQHETNEIGARGSQSAVASRLELIRSGWYARQLQAAAKIYGDAGGCEPIVTGTADFISAPHQRSWRARLAGLRLVLVHGRRRLRDRLVLAASALAGWI